MLEYWNNGKMGLGFICSLESDRIETLNVAYHPFNPTFQHSTIPLFQDWGKRLDQLNL